MEKPVITQFGQIAPLIVQEYERYLPTAFDESLSLLEKLNKVIQKLNEIGLVTNDLITQWNEVMEWVMNDGLNEAVIERLNEMVADGTLDEIINVVLFGQHMKNFNSRGVNIEIEGAVPDGLTDNTTIIQDLINEGYNLFIPEGVFLTNQLTLKNDNQIILGVGTLKLGNSQYSPIIYANGKKNVKVMNIQLDGNSSGNPLDNGNFNYMGVPRSSQRMGCILLESCTDSTIENVRIEKAHSSPAVLYRCVNSVITKCVSKNHMREGIGIDSGKNCTISDCYSYYDYTTGIALPWSLIFTTGEIGDGGKHKHKVINNNCADSQAAFITINTEQTEVRGNIVRKTMDVSVTSGTGIRLGHTDDGTDTSRRAYECVVADNLLIDIDSTTPFSNNSRAISCDNGTGSTIENNTIINCHTGIGVSVTVGQSVNVRNNTIKDSTVDGIRMSNVLGGSVSGNHLKGNPVGIFVQGENIAVNNNYVEGYTTFGIRLKYGAGALTGMTLIGNTVVGSVSTNYDVDGSMGATNNFRNNVGRYADEREILFGSAPPITAHKKGTVMFNSVLEGGEPAGWICITDAGTTWEAFGYVKNGKKGKATFNGDGVATQLIIQHDLNMTVNKYNVQEGSSGAGTAEISYVRAFNSQLEVNFKNPLPVGTNNIVLDWFVEN